MPISQRILPRTLAWPVAPALGWAVHSALVLPVFLLIGFSKVTVLGVALLSLVVAIAAIRRSEHRDADAPEPHVATWAYAGAALLAVGVAIAIVPKAADDGVILAAPIFDHAKVAIIDEMTRLGVPPGNPFFGEASPSTRLAYYYLWHFSAAELALATGASGWEADIASTWIAAFSSLALMMGLATWLSGRASAALWVLLLAATASARTVLSAAFGFENVSSVLLPQTGFAGWLFQAAWVPQHIASASCVVLAILLISRLMQQPSGLLIVTLALVVGAGFESSTWIGGVTFLLAASSVSVVLLVPAKTDQRLSFLLNASAAAVLAAFLTAPFVYDQIIATAMRDGGPPIAVMHYRVLGPAFPEGVGRILDLPAYWLVLLVVEFPAIYVTGLIALTSALTSRALDCERQRVATTFAVLAGVSLAVGWLLVSTLADNNDLGWRAILPAAMVLIIFATIGLSGWIAARAHVAAVAAVCALAVGGIEGGALVYGNAVGRPSASAKTFAATPAMWAEVRRHSAPDERITNNPLFLQDMTPWPVNISWALLADRRSCFAGRELTLPYTPLPRAQREEINARFIRVFQGGGTPDDLRALSLRDGCRLIVVTAEDAIWNHDPFAASQFYAPVATTADRWRIYRARDRLETERNVLAGEHSGKQAGHQIPLYQLKPRSAQ